MRELKIKDWFIFGEWYGIFLFHACYFEGLVETIKERLGYGLTQALMEQTKDIQRIYLSRSEWSKIGKRYLEEVIESPVKLAMLLSEIRNAANQLILFSSNLKKLNVSRLTRSQRLRWLEKYHKAHHRLWSLGQVTNVLELENYFLADYLKSSLLNKNLGSKDQVNFFHTLITPRELSMAQKEEREMLKLATIKNPGIKLRNHWRKYSWLNFGWTGPSLTLEYFVGCHEGLYRDHAVSARLAKILAKDTELVASKQTILEKLKLTRKVENLFRLLEDLLFVKAHRMDALFMSYEAVQPLLRSIAKDNNLSLPQVYSLDASWLVKMVRNNLVEVNKINEIARYSVQYFDGKKIFLLTGHNAKEVANRVKKNLPKIQGKVELKGETAFPGKVRGRVVIVNLAKEMSKFKRGDILVSSVTDPSLLPIMKKARAFVTNMGGLTAHAAIVARELSKPCVVGTKVATRVLKDGDMVEVDATNGIVRKL